MSARAPSLKQCPRSHCRFQSGSDDDIRGHIINYHRRRVKRTACGEYTIKTRYYKKKHEDNCGKCSRDAPAAQTVIPSIEHDAESDNISIAGAGPQESEAVRAGRNHGMFFNGPNYGNITLTVKTCSASPSCSADSN